MNELVDDVEPLPLWSVVVDAKGYAWQHLPMVVNDSTGWYRTWAEGWEIWAGIRYSQLVHYHGPVVTIHVGEQVGPCS